MSIRSSIFEINGDEEPPFKYKKLTSDVTISTLKDSASIIKSCSEFIALGTHAGYLHLFSHSGHRIKAFKPHTATINDISFDSKHEFIATASVDGQVFVTSVYGQERYYFNFKRPMKAISLDPQFSKKSSRAFICGGMAGELTLNEKGWFGHVQKHLQPLNKDEGPICSCIWKDNTIAWSNDKGVRIYDILNSKLIAFVEKISGLPRPDLFRVSLCFTDNHTLIIGWGNIIRIVKLINNNNGGNFNNSNNTIARIESTFEMDATVSSVVPYDDTLLVLAWLEPDGALLADEYITDKSAQRKRTSKRPELRVLTLDGEESAEDRLPIRDFYLYSCNDYKLISSEFPTRNGIRSGFYFMSPRDIVRVETRDEVDHVHWLIDGGKYEEALECALELKCEHDLNLDELGQKFLKSLIDEDNYDKAASKASSILGTNINSWQDLFYAFANSDKLDSIIPFIPIKNPQLDQQVYGIILHYLLHADITKFYETIKTYPKEIYDIDSIIIALQTVIENDESEMLLESLAELYLINRQPGKVLPLYLKLEKYEVFDLIINYSLWTDIQYQALELIKFNERLGVSQSQTEWQQTEKHGIAIKMLVEHTYSIQIDKVVNQLRNENRYLYMYLDSLREFDGTLVERFTDDLVELYAEYDYEKLIGYLRTNTTYNLEKAYKECERRDYVQEMVFLLGRMGSNKLALSLIIERLGDAKRAITFAKEQNDDELWDDLLKYSESKPTFIKALLENVGPEIDPVRLIKIIKNGVEIPGLKEALIKILQDFNIQVSLLEGCQSVIRSDCQTLSKKLIKLLTKGRYCSPQTKCYKTNEKGFNDKEPSLVYLDGKVCPSGSMISDERLNFRLNSVDKKLAWYSKFKSLTKL